MRKIISFAVNNPVTILMMVLAIMLLGKISYDKLSVDLLPDMNNPKLFVEIKAGERPPEEIEKQFIKGMEAMAIRQRDVLKVSSVIKAGTAQMTVEYTWNKDMDEAFLDLQKAMNGFSQNENITELQITQNDPNTSPIIVVGMSHSSIEDMAELRKVADSYIRNELVRVEGVADVMLSGDEVSNLVIKTNPYKLDAYGLSINTIAQKIEENNQRISGGRVTEMGAQYIVSGVTMLNTEADFGKIIVGYKDVESTSGTTLPVASELSVENKAPIYLSDVAEIRFENEAPENIVRIDGKRCIGLSVYKEMRYNTVKAVEGVAERLKTIEKALPGYQFNIVSNQGVFINSAIGEVKESAVMGILLAVLVLFVFLRRLKVTLIISLAIPISIIATFNLMFFNNLTLNIMTLGGLALGAGMLVDNAIVVIESIFRNQEKGLSVKEAVVLGASEVGGAITASTLTTIVVFLPIVYLHGASGELFKDQAWTVTFSLLSSLFVAILVIPTLYDRIFGGKEHREKVTKHKEPIQITGYSSFLRKVIAKRWLVIGLTIVLVVGTYCLVPYIGAEFMPKSESSSFTIKVKMNEGTRLERTASTVENLENLIYEITQDSLCTVYSHIGPGSGNVSSIFDGENTALIKVILSSESSYAPAQLMSELFTQTADIEGLELSFQQEENSLGSLMGDEEAPVVIEIKGEELEELSSIAQEVKLRAEAIDGLFNVTNSIEDGAPEMILTINRSVAGMNNLSVSTIITQIREQLTGKSVGQMDYKGEMRDIKVKVPEITLSQFQEMVITGTGNKVFRLAELAEIKQGTAPKEIYRRNQNRIVKVLANLENNYSLSQVSDKIRESVQTIDLPANYTITVTGEEEKRQESMASLLFALTLSIILVYMVMASQFESLLHPFTILLTIPLALVGAIWLFFITDTTINIMGIIGMIMLVGIAVNNSIILVDRINQLKEDTTLTDAIVFAGQQRIRPILMTSLTTILALLPMTFGFGDGASLRAPMAIAVIGGLLTSTILSLIVIPCVYYLFERMKMRFRGMN